MKRLCFISISICLVFIDLMAQGGVDFNELDLLAVRDAAFFSPSILVQRGIKEEQAFRLAQYEELEYWRHQVAVTFELKSATLKKTKQEMIEYVKADIIARISKDIKIFEDKIEKSRNDKENTTSEFRHNHAINLLLSVKKLIRNKIQWMLLGEPVDGMPVDKNLPRIIAGYSNDIKGQQEDLELKLANILLITCLTNKNTINELDDRYKEKLRKSAFMQLIPLPKRQERAMWEEFELFFESKDKLLQRGFLLPHGGYALRNDEIVHLDERENLAQDCSYWISSLLGLKRRAFTETFYKFHLDYFQKDKDEKKVLPEYAFLTEKVTPIKVTEIKDVKPGYLVCFFREQTEQNPKPSGHIALVVSTDSLEKSVIFLERTRNLPTEEGFGYKKRLFSQLASNSEQKILFFLPKEDYIDTRKVKPL
ncbi:MAG: hypothetical protein A2007_04445 [Verrucomicrobia bacterium GWC2_42_7]|nr:MAG: hypothetical protein A2007_04445 [Verrucomicrobia bacterium GWC2_42_7]